MKTHIHSITVALPFCLFLVSCKHNGTSGRNGLGSTLLNALTSTCTATTNGNIAPPTLNIQTLANNNIVALVCSYEVNDLTSWANYSQFRCATVGGVLSTYNTSDESPFTWNGSNSDPQFNASTVTPGTVPAGTVFNCATACTATYKNGTSNYILLIGQGTCE